MMMMMMQRWRCRQGGMQALWGYEGINGKLVKEGNTAHIFARPKIIQLGKFGAGYPRLRYHFHQAFLLYRCPREDLPVDCFVFLTVSSGFLTTGDCLGFCPGDGRFTRCNCDQIIAWLNRADFGQLNMGLRKYFCFAKLLDGGPRRAANHSGHRRGGIRRDFAMVIVCPSVSGGAVLHYTANIL